MIIRIELGDRSYDVVVEKGVAERASELLNIDRKVFLSLTTAFRQNTPRR